MSAIIYSQLSINLECIQQIKKVRMRQRINEHAFLYLTAILSDQYKDDYVKKTLKRSR
jgi:hypothetical protein